MSRIVAYVPDLMDRSKITAAGGDVSFVASPAALAAAAEGAEVVVVDLTRPGVVEAVAALPVRVIGFANHVERDLMDAAGAAGCEVMARSAFFARVGELLGSG